MSDRARWARRQLGYTFRDAGLLEHALTHRSRSAANNERLEFLGDAVLGCVIADALHARESAADEGDLSRLRALLVRREALVELARGLGVGDQLVLGGGEARSGGHQRQSILADALEALFGAVYRDGGFAAAQEVILHLYRDALANLPPAATLKDPKTRLQEHVQANALCIPQYAVTRATGPDHDRSFTVSCRMSELDLTTTGTGSSRRRAEQIAAAAMLEALDEGREQ